MKLPKASRSLMALCAYLVKKGCENRLLALKVQYSAGQDQRNLASPRAFCYVDARRPTTIFCGSAIESIPEEFRSGVLLHEIGHIVEKIGGPHDEAKADTWIVAVVPEAGYGYADCTYTHADLRRTAHDLQAVSPAFLENLGLRR